jgi:hypothetical protein
MQNPKTFAAVLFVLFAGAISQTMAQTGGKAAKITHIPRDFAVSDLDNDVWKEAKEVTVTTYWSGDQAPSSRQFKARLLWSNKALYVRFETGRGEPLVVSRTPDLTKKTLQLWDRDVCEIFIAPDAASPKKYFEFEIAPTGEWIDLAIDLTSGIRQTDWDYSSGMTSAARIEDNRVVMALKVDWKALGKTPKAGDAWRGNLFRCVGKDPTRGYLAWRPTKTKEPSFHVPEKFGEFGFVK